MEFSRQEYWSGLPFPSPGDLPDPGNEPTSPAWAHGFFTTEPPVHGVTKSHTWLSDWMTKIKTYHDSAISILGIHPREIKTFIYIKMYVLLFITAIFIIVKHWKQHRWRCPPVSPCDTRSDKVIVWRLPAHSPCACLPHPLTRSHLNRKYTRCDVTNFISESSFSRMAFLEHSYKWAQKQILDKDSICIHMLYWYHCTAKNSLGFPDSICVAQDQSFPMFSLSSVYYYIMIIFYNVLIILHNV